MNCKSFRVHCNFSTSSFLLKKPPKHFTGYPRIVTDQEVDRINTGKPRTGSEYGPLTDKPDWNFFDGRVGYRTSGQVRRSVEQYSIAKNICTIKKELESIQKLSMGISTLPTTLTEVAKEAFFSSADEKAEKKNIIEHDNNNNGKGSVNK